MRHQKLLLFLSTVISFISKKINYHAPYVHHLVSVFNAVEAPKVEVKAVPVAYAHAPFAYAAGYPHVYAAHYVVNKPVTYTHNVPDGVLTHTNAGHPAAGEVLPVFTARRIVSGVLPVTPAAEAVVDE